MRKPRLTRQVIDGLAIIEGLAREDIFSDQKRDWGHAHKGLAYIRKLREWHKANKGVTVGAGGDVP